VGVEDRTDKSDDYDQFNGMPPFAVKVDLSIRLGNEETPYLRRDRDQGTFVKKSVGGIRNQAFRIPKNKRVTMRKVRQRNPRSRGFLFHLSEFALRPVPFVASEAAKRVQYSPECQGLGQAWQLIL
jgi:hypothetical protein